MADLAEWFAAIPPARYESDNRTYTVAEQTDRRAETVAVSVSGIGQSETHAPDPLALPWCADHGDEISGIGMDQSAALPSLCLGCAGLLRTGCDWLAGMPSSDDASYCTRFRPRVGVVVGRCWLWRVELSANKAVWFMALPPVGQSVVIQWARQHYGDVVQGVYPVPGALALPERK
ncbi:hypothetical protein THUN1379_26980 [Paludibacterium sp. THUN1379]|uniref:hypothetical protein n=1 Tax=Paludibacterium sp. THUN1379 TaxID=3112107 RepID=UPI003093AF6A|nr:hypothetical protein THUN1379_26980 [Paludibacterium sp. THUN1379]